MAAAFDAFSSRSIDIGGESASVSWAHTCTGTDLLLVMGVICIGPPGSLNATYNSVPLTLLASKIDPGGTQFAKMFIVLPPPTAGTFNFTITQTAPLKSFAAAGLSMNGVRQVTQVSPHVDFYGTGQASVTVNGVSNDDLLFDFFLGNTGTTDVTPAETGQVERGEVVGASFARRIEVSTRPGTYNVSGAENMSWNPNVVDFKWQVALTAFTAHTGPPTIPGGNVVANKTQGIIVTTGFPAVGVV